MKTGFYQLVDIKSFDATIVFVTDDGSVRTNDGILHHMDEFRSDRVHVERIDITGPFFLTMGKWNGPSLADMLGGHVSMVNIKR